MSSKDGRINGEPASLSNDPPAATIATQEDVVWSSDSSDGDDGWVGSLTVSSSTWSKKRKRKSKLRLDRDSEEDALKRLLKLKPAKRRNATQERDEQKRTILHIAARKGWDNMVKALLLEYSADPNVFDEDRRTPLHHAIESIKDNGSGLKARNILRHLLDKGALPNESDEDGVTPLLAAIMLPGTIETLETLLSYSSVDIDYTVRFQSASSTALHVACKQDKFRVAKLLLEHGANPLSKDGGGDTPLYIVLKKRNALSCLFAGTLLDVCQKKGLDVREILTTTNHGGKPTIFRAVTTGNTELVRKCLDLVDSNSSGNADHEDETTSTTSSMAPLSKLTSERGENLMHAACKSGHLDIVRLLYERCPELVEGTTSQGQTPLHVASRKDHPSIAKELCHMGDKECGSWREGYEDKQGNSPLHVAAERGHYFSVRVLIDYKHLVASKNNEGHTPLHLSTKHGWAKTSRLLIEADPTQINERDHKGKTPLHYACEVGRMTTIDTLLDHKAKVLLCDHKKLTCLDYAINRGHEDAVIKLLRHDHWHKLLAHATMEDGRLTTPFRKVIKSMPVASKFLLDRCIERGTSDQHNYSVTLNFEFIEDWYSSWMNDVTTSKHDVTRKRSSGKCDKENRNNQNEETNFDGDGRLKNDAKIYVTDPEVRAESHPLKIMLASPCSELISHPVVAEFCRHKWNKLGRFAFWASLFVYFTFVIFLTGHVMVIPPKFYINVSSSSSLPSSSVSSSSDGYVWLADGEKRWVEDANWMTFLVFGEVGMWMILFWALCNALLLAYRLTLLGLRSLLTSIDQFLNVLIDLVPLVLAAIFALPLGDLEYRNGVNFKLDWQWGCGAAAVFFAWLNLVIYLKRITFIGIYVLMFVEVCWSFLKFASIFGIFVFAFSIAFYMLLMNQDLFNTLGDSLSNTFAMSTGEFSFPEIFHAFDYMHSVDIVQDFVSIVFYPTVTHILFSLFIIIVPILAMNLLTGLAVGDVGTIQQKAKMYRRNLQVEAILRLQYKLPTIFWRRTVVQKRTFKLKKHVSAFKMSMYELDGWTDEYEYLINFADDFERKGFVKAETTPDMKLDGLLVRVNDVNFKLNLLTSMAAHEDQRMHEFSKTRDAHVTSGSRSDAQDSFSKTDYATTADESDGAGIAFGSKLQLRHGAVEEKKEVSATSGDPGTSFDSRTDGGKDGGSKEAPVMNGENDGDDGDVRARVDRLSERVESLRLQFASEMLSINNKLDRLFEQAKAD